MSCWPSRFTVRAKTKGAKSNKEAGGSGWGWGRRDAIGQRRPLPVRPLPSFRISLGTPAASPPPSLKESLRIEAKSSQIRRNTLEKALQLRVDRFFLRGGGGGGGGGGSSLRFLSVLGSIKRRLPSPQRMASTCPTRE